MLSILAAALHLGLIVRLGERLLLSSEVRSGSVGCEIQLRTISKHSTINRIGVVSHLRPIVRRFQHDGTVAELLNEAVLSLDGFEKSAGVSLRCARLSLLAYEISATLSLLKQFQR